MRQTNGAQVDEGFRAITSLSRALGGEVELADVGSLLWVVLRQMIPCDTMALFLPDRRRARLAVHYASGAHADQLDGLTRPMSSGIAGWVFNNQRAVLNAEPVFDLGSRVSSAPSLRSSVVVPLVDNGTVVAVLALYSKNLLGFTDDHVSLLELLGPRLALALSARSTGVADDALTIVPRPALQLVPRETRLPLYAADIADHSL